jgi:hypothetical protein
MLVADLRTRCQEVNWVVNQRRVISGRSRSSRWGTDGSASNPRSPWTTVGAITQLRMTTMPPSGRCSNLRPGGNTGSAAVGARALMVNGTPAEDAGTARSRAIRA